MYDQKFSKIYDEYGWDYFSLTMCKAILEYFKIHNIKIENNLDLCCGTGVLCNYFYNNKIRTKGVDHSEYMIEIAKNKNSSIEFIEEDVLIYKDNEKYDLITMTCDALNHFIKENDVNYLMANINKLLIDGGFLIFDVYDKNNIDLNKKIVSNRDNNIKVYYYITCRDNLINTNVIIKKNAELVYETNIIEKLYDLDYLKDILKKNGFEILQATNKILNEEQRFKDKIYFICQKVDNL